MQCQQKVLWIWLRVDPFSLQISPDPVAHNGAATKLLSKSLQVGLSACAGSDLLTEKEGETKDEEFIRRERLKSGGHG